MDKYPRVPQRVTINDPMLVRLIEILKGGEDADGLYLLVRHKKRLVKFGRIREEDLVAPPHGPLKDAPNQF